MERVRRKEDWLQNLNSFIEERRHKPFSFGEQDCCLFACDAVKVMTGTDLGADFRGYKGKRETLEILKQYKEDVKTIAEIVTDKYNIKENKNINRTHKGDLVLLKNNDRYLMGIYYSKAQSYCPTNNGICILGPNEVVKTWGIPF